MFILYLAFSSLFVFFVLSDYVTSNSIDRLSGVCVWYSLDCGIVSACEITLYTWMSNLVHFLLQWSTSAGMLASHSLDWVSPAHENEDSHVLHHPHTCFNLTIINICTRIVKCSNRYLYSISSGLQGLSICKSKITCLLINSSSGMKRDIYIHINNLCTQSIFYIFL